ncbi:MAG: hypothetical protein OXN21_16975 [Chloroflexota bacterium]|nr:hypothetical protein [Chloroflexota bacterium]
MAAARQKFSSQAPPEILDEMREIARREGRQFQTVLEEAMRHYIEDKNSGNIRPEVMHHFQASVDRNERLYDLLAQ